MATINAPGWNFAWRIVAVLLLSFLFCIGLDAQTFQPACRIPYQDLLQHHPIDDKCPAEGTSPDQAKRAQNLVENNLCAAGVVQDMTFTDFVEAQQKAQVLPRKLNDRSALRSLGEGRVVRAIAYVADARYSDVLTGEAVNCYLPGSESKDVRVSLVSSPGDGPCSQIVAEIIPHLRPAAWTPEALNRLSDHQFRFTGQLFYDGKHAPCTG